jgi:hypothetical protein
MEMAKKNCKTKGESKIRTISEKPDCKNRLYLSTNEKNKNTILSQWDIL